MASGDKEERASPLARRVSSSALAGHGGTRHAEVKAKASYKARWSVKRPALSTTFVGLDYDLQSDNTST